MALSLTSGERSLLRNHRIEPGWFLDLFVDAASLHCSNLYTALSYDVGDGTARTYEPLGDRWQWPDTGISMGPDATPEPIVITFDASRIADDTDFVGRFADAAWHRRRARLSLVLFAVDGARTNPVKTYRTWEGEMDFRQMPEQDGVATTLALTIESGSFRYSGRNMQTRTDENQQALFPGDTFFQDWPALIGRQIPWGRKWITAGAYGTASVEPAGGGRGVNSGGFITPIVDRPNAD